MAPQPAAATPSVLIAYYRVSTERQGRSGLGLEAQQHSVEEYAKRSGRTIAGAYTEIESGRRRDRPQLAGALARAKAVGGTVVVAKLDRLARDVALILKLVDSGIPILFLDLPEISADPIVGRLVLTIMAAIAEFESRRIGQRIKEALARRRARGLKQPGFLDPAAQQKASAAEVAARRRIVKEFRERVQPLVLGLKAKARTFAQTALELNARGILTFRGKRWTLANLERFLSTRCNRPRRRKRTR